MDWAHVHLALRLDFDDAHQAICSGKHLDNTTKGPLSTARIRLHHENNIILFQVLLSVEPFLSVVEAWQELLPPSLPKLSQQLLHSVPSLPGIVGFFTEKVGGKCCTHLANDEMVGCQRGEVVYV